MVTQDWNYLDIVDWLTNEIIIVGGIYNITTPLFVNNKMENIRVSNGLIAVQINNLLGPCISIIGPGPRSTIAAPLGSKKVPGGFEPQPLDYPLHADN